MLLARCPCFLIFSIFPSNVSQYILCFLANCPCFPVFNLFPLKLSVFPSISFFSWLIFRLSQHFLCFVANCSCFPVIPLSNSQLFVFPDIILVWLPIVCVSYYFLYYNFGVRFPSFLFVYWSHVHARIKFPLLSLLPDQLSVFTSSFFVNWPIVHIN